jgi:histidine triad (HIT) family protein
MSKLETCLFCKMADGEIKVPKIYEDAAFFCIKDIHPQAKEHLLVIPKVHIETLDMAFSANVSQSTELENIRLVGKLFEVGTQVARQCGLLPGGFRSVINTGPNSGQTVFHIHLHLLGGEVLNSHFG